MKNNTIFEYADNGIIIRYEDDNSVEVAEEGKFNDTFLDQNDLTSLDKTIGMQYGGIIANTLNCFRKEDLKGCIGFKVFIEIVPVFEEKHLFPKRKKQ